MSQDELLFIKAQAYLYKWYKKPSARRHVQHEMVLTEAKEVYEHEESVSCRLERSCDLKPDVLFPLEPTFSKKLFEFIRQKGISETECYKRAHLDRRLFSKIRSDDNYQPNKNTVFALILGLHLNLLEAKELLKTAGYSISHSMKKDVLIEFCIKEQKYDIIKVNELLHRNRCALLGTT